MTNVSQRMTDNLSLAALRNLIAGRKLYVWGAGNQGRGIARVLRDNGLRPDGFIDSSPDMTGKEFSASKVRDPSIIDETDKDKIFIIIGVFFYEREIAELCQQHGLQPEKDYLHYSSLKPRDYSVDVSGTCNLRCISCPRAATHGNRPGGFMSLETFRTVIDKIKAEDPFVGNIQLYQWGEPTLNKNLPEMIAYARSKGIYPAISSNLNLSVDYQRIIEARPEWFRVSASGWGKEYEITHTGGRWDIFLKNLKLVAALRQQLYPEMKLELFYHLYQHSIGENLRKFSDLCAELSIEFHPVYAYLISLDDVLKRQEGTPLPPTALNAQGRMLLDLDQGLDIAREERTLPCDAFRSIHINPDLSVSNCMMYFYPEENRSVPNYLDAGIEEIMTIRKKCNLCRRCMKHALHRYCGAYSTFAPNFAELSRDE